MLAVIIKGNPKFIQTPLAKAYYHDIETFLKKVGFDTVEYDAGADYSRPRQDADLYVAHSRGTGRYEFMSNEAKKRFVKLGSLDGFINPVDAKWQKEVWKPGTNIPPPDEHFKFTDIQKGGILKKMKALKIEIPTQSTESLHRAATPEEKRLIDLALKDPRLGPSAVTTDPDQLVWVYDDNKKKVGFFTPKKEPDGRYRTGTIFIEPSERGKGYGSYAVNSFFNGATTPGRAWIEPTNIPSQTIFKKAGFYKSGRHTMSKTTPRLFEEWINRPEPPLVSRPVLGW